MDPFDRSLQVQELHSIHGICSIFPCLHLRLATVNIACIYNLHALPISELRRRADSVVAVTSQEPGKGCERVTPGGQCDNVGTGRDHGAMVGYGGHSDRDTAQWEQLTPAHGHGHCCSQGWRI